MSPAVQVEGRRLDPAAVPDRRRRQGLVRRRRRCQEHGRGDRLCRHRLRGDESHPGDGGAEHGGQVHDPRHQADPAASAAFKNVGTTGEVHIVNPPKSAPTRVSDLDLYLRDHPADDANAASLKQFVFWALTKGQPIRGETPLRADLRSRCWCSPRSFSKRSTARSSRYQANEFEAPSGASNSFGGRCQPGNVQRIRRPRPGPPSASMSPPAAATTCFTIASPRPVPREVRAASAR